MKTSWAQSDIQSAISHGNIPRSTQVDLHAMILGSQVATFSVSFNGKQSLPEIFSAFLS